MASFANPNCLGAIAAFRRVFIKPIMAGRDASAKPSEAALASQRSVELAGTLSSFVLRRTAEILEKYLPPKSARPTRVRVMRLQHALIWMPAPAQRI